MLADFVSVVLADTEDTWHLLFQKMGRTYREPNLVLFSGAGDMSTRILLPMAPPDSMCAGLNGAFKPEMSCNVTHSRRITFEYVTL
jgi:predicted metalloprotease